MVLKLNQLEKSFGKKKVLQSLDFGFEYGVYGLLGPNGAGKTTLIRCMTQLYPVKSGSLYFHGQEIRTNKAYREQIGYLPQKFGLFKELTVSEMLQMMANLKGVSKDKVKSEVERCVALVNLQDRLNSKVKTLSGGMIRRLGIAQAILNDPEILFFDEPTAGLDPEERLRFKNIISQLKGDRTILISTHIVEDVETLCNNVLVMSEGKILAHGTCNDIQNHATGKVYEIPEEQRAQIAGPYHIQRMFERDGRKLLKILVAKSQEQARPVKATVEDGYICILKNI